MSQDELQRQKRQHARRQARKIMAGVAEASAGGTITYTELADRIDAINYAANGKPLTIALCEISRATLAEGKGVLSAVVVRDDRGYPGDGFFDFLRDRGRIDPSDQVLTDDEKRAAWAAEREVVARAWHSQP